MHGTAAQAAEVEALAEELAGIIAADRGARDGSASHSGHIDNTPGGSPDPYTGAAPAPRREWRAPERFSTRPRRETSPDGRLTVAELRSRAYAAARLAMRSRQWGPEHYADAASYVVEAVLRRTNWTGTRHGRPRDVLAWITFCERWPMEAARRERANTGTVPMAAATGLVLYHLATDARIHMERDTGRTEQAITAAFTAEVVAADTDSQLRRRRDLLATPRKARLTAVHMLADLDLSTAWGPLLTVAYTAARAPWKQDTATGELAPISGDDIASELDLTHTAYRKHMSRGRKALAENVTSEGWMAASLHLIDPLAGSGATHAASLESDWRTDRAPMPVETRRVKPRPRKTPAAWTRDLPASTAHRLHAAAVARQARAGLAPEDRTRATV